MRRRVTWALGSVAMAIGLTVGPMPAAQAVSVPPALIYATNAAGQILTFVASAPGTILASPTITGLQPGEVIVGIDIRPADGLIYGVGSTSRLYTINPTTGAASAVGAPGAFTLNGTSFGVDFNPTVDRLRVVSDADQNLRLNPNTGALAAVDPALNPGNPNVVGGAYTNNFAGATTTTLYDIDSVTDTLYTQVPANNGTLNPVGPLGVDTSALVGFDILWTGTADHAFATLTTAATPLGGLYNINLATGAASLVGAIGGGSAITGMTARLEADAPTCKVVAVRRPGPSGRDEMDVQVQDTGSGLKAITNVSATNAVLSYPVFTPGTTAPITVTAIKTTQGQTATFSFDAIDMAGNIRHCA